MKSFIFLGIILLCWNISPILSAANFTSLPPFFAQKYTSVPGARSLLLDAAGDILVVSRQFSHILAIFDTPQPNGSVIVNQVLIVNGSSWRITLNHGLAYDAGFLYASNDVEVYRWEYKPGQRKLIQKGPELVIRGIPPGGHATRSLIFDELGLLYVNVGSAGDVDPDSSRSRVRRFNLQVIPSGGLDFESGEIFADGVRNIVGFGFDAQKVLWGLEISANVIDRPDLGDDIKNGNPAEELMRLENTGSFYGYPYCFSSYKLEGYVPGTQFAWPTFMNDGVHNDTWCRTVENNIPPVLSLPDHSTPLGITFYDGHACSTSTGAFPCSAVGDAVIALHGANPSFNDPPTGYSVRWLTFDHVTNLPTGDYIDVIYDHARDCREAGGPEGCFRHVNAIFDLGGHLIVSADASGELFRVYYNATPPEII